MLQLLDLEVCSCNCSSQGKVAYASRFLISFIDPRQTTSLRSRTAVDLELEVLVLNPALSQVLFDFRTLCMCAN